MSKIAFKPIPWPVFFGVGAFLLLVHAAWYLGVWPGPIGEDGYSVIANIERGVPKYSGKEAGWLLYVLVTYGATWRLEAVVIPLILLQIAIFTRILSWAYAQGYRKTALFFLVWIACAPHVMNFEVSLYPDAVFSLAFIGVLFEVWVGLKEGRANPYGAWAIACMLPVAAFFKANGILIFAPVLYLAYRWQGRWRWFLVAACVFWGALVQVGSKVHDLGNGHGALKPLVLFETVNFMQSKPMGLWENRQMVTERTQQIIYKYISQQDIDSLYDRDYWDTLWHQNRDRVRFWQMTAEDRRALRYDFFTYNLWRNLPAFLSSRVNVFLASAFAQGGIVRPDNAMHYINRLQTVSERNFFELEVLPDFVDKAFHLSYDWRFLWWTPFLGVFLIVVCAWTAMRQRAWDDVVVTWTLLAQLGGIFVFSIAAEYRYLLLIFYSPLLLVPLWYLQKRQG